MKSFFQKCSVRRAKKINFRRVERRGARAVAAMAQPFLLENGHLSVPLHILQMPGGRLPVPNRTKEILVEIGTNSFDTWDTQVLPRRPGAFLVSFEPLVDKWALMLSRNARSRVFSPLGWHNPRGVILPFAVSDRAGIVPFHVSPRDGCSSLRRPQTPKRGGWKSNGFVRNACAKTVETRMVPAITLRTVLEEWLRGWRVSRLKIDAQGSDLSVLAAAGASVLRGVDAVSMETLHDDCDGIYEGQPNCTTIVLGMAALGFQPTGGFRCELKRHFTQGSGCEANVDFRNANAPAATAPELISMAGGGNGGGGGGGGRGFKRRGRGRRLHAAAHFQ